MSSVEVFDELLQREFDDVALRKSRLVFLGNGEETLAMRHNHRAREPFRGQHHFSPVTRQHMGSSHIGTNCTIPNHIVAPD